jgi:hypothetical protein
MNLVTSFSHVPTAASAERHPPMIRRAWDGELPLWLTYWVWGVGGNVSFALLLVRAARATSDRRAGLMAPWAIYLASLGWFVLIFGAIWRSAGRYHGPRLWAALARLGVTSGIVRMAGELAALLLLTALTRERDHRRRVTGPAMP